MKIPVNLKTASDFEINMALAEYLPPVISGDQSAYRKSRSSAVLVNDIVSEWEFDPCNSISDAWPLILEYHIRVTPRPDNHVGKPKAEAWGPHAYAAACDNNDRLLRAAMEVILQILQSKNQSMVS